MDISIGAEAVEQNTLFDSLSRASKSYTRKRGAGVFIYFPPVSIDGHRVETPFLTLLDYIRNEANRGALTTTEQLLNTIVRLANDRATMLWRGKSDEKVEATVLHALCLLQIDITAAIEAILFARIKLLGILLNYREIKKIGTGKKDKQKENLKGQSKDKGNPCCCSSELVRVIRRAQFVASFCLSSIQNRIDHFLDNYIGNAVYSIVLNQMGPETFLILDDAPLDTSALLIQLIVHEILSKCLDAAKNTCRISQQVSPQITRVVNVTLTSLFCAILAFQPYFSARGIAALYAEVLALHKWALFARNEFVLPASARLVHDAQPWARAEAVLQTLMAAELSKGGSVGAGAGAISSLDDQRELPLFVASAGIPLSLPIEEQRKWSALAGVQASSIGGRTLRKHGDTLMGCLCLPTLTYRTNKSNLKPSSVCIAMVVDTSDL